MKKYIQKYYSYIVIAILILIFVFIKIPKIGETYKNEDATYHTLLTMKCYEETPAKIHKFLPIVSLGHEDDKNIPWGACVQDNNGNYYYTSFSSVGFVAPYLFVKMFHLPINIYSLYVFNSIICIATLIIIIYIFNKLFSKYISKDLIAIFTTLIYLFQIEVMQSQGNIFWVHSIFQLLIAIQFALFLNYDKTKCKVLFYVMCAIMPYTEWTGYVSNVGFALVLFIRKIIDDKKLTIKSFVEPLIIGILTILSAGLFIFHFLLNIEPSIFFEAIKQRFFARNITSGANIKYLIIGYIISYKYLLILITILFIGILCTHEYRTEFFKLVKEYKYVIILFAFIMLENVIMLEHAINYTFDRLKLCYLLLTIFYILICTIFNVNQKTDFLKNIITVVLICVAIFNIRLYKLGYGGYIEYNLNNARNQQVAAHILQNYNYDNSTYCCNLGIRGYMNLLFERGIYENVSYEAAKDITKQKNKQYLIYIILDSERIINRVVISDMYNNIEQTVYTDFNLNFIVE